MSGAIMAPLKADNSKKNEIGLIGVELLFCPAGCHILYFTKVGPVLTLTGTNNWQQFKGRS